MKSPLFLHGLLFNVVWFASVALTSAPLAVMALIAWVFFFPPSHKERIFIGVMATLGLLIEVLLAWQSWISFDPQPATLIPVWLMTLWIGFSRFSYQWLSHTNIPLIGNCLLFCVAATINYAAGERLGAASIDWSNTIYSAIFVIWWFAFMAICHQLIQRFNLWTETSNSSEPS